MHWFWAFFSLHKNLYIFLHSFLKGATFLNTVLKSHYILYYVALGQWFLTFVTRMFLNCNSQKPQPAQLLVKASGSCSPKLLSNPRLRTSALENMVAALSMHLSRSTSRERVSEIIEPRYTNLWTTSNSYVEMLIDGGESTPWPMTCVFFRLIVNPKSWQILLKQFRNCSRSSAKWATTDASSAKRKSCMHFSWTLVFALNLERLKSFPSDLVRH